MLAPDDPLGSARLKLIRAKEHLDQIKTVCEQFRDIDCKAVAEIDHDTRDYIRVLRLPPLPELLPAIIGDALYCLRSSLDHIVWSLAKVEAGVAVRTNQFPICTSHKNFIEQLGRQRLKGISPQAQALIETLQPYPGRDQSLAVLDELHNFDKHQFLNLTSVACVSIAIEKWVHQVLGGSATIFNMFRDELRDGTKICDIDGIPDHMEVKFEGQAFIAFEDFRIRRERVNIFLAVEKIHKFIAETVIPALEPFFNRQANSP